MNINNKTLKNRIRESKSYLIYLADYIVLIYLLIIYRNN